MHELLQSKAPEKKSLQKLRRWLEEAKRKLYERKALKTLRLMLEEIEVTSEQRIRGKEYKNFFKFLNQVLEGGLNKQLLVTSLTNELEKLLKDKKLSPLVSTLLSGIILELNPNLKSFLIEILKESLPEAKVLPALPFKFLNASKMIIGDVISASHCSASESKLLIELLELSKKGALVTQIIFSDVKDRKPLFFVKYFGDYLMLLSLDWCLVDNGVIAPGVWYLIYTENGEYYGHPGMQKDQPAPFVDRLSEGELAIFPSRIFDSRNLERRLSDDPRTFEDIRNQIRNLIRNQT